MQALQYPNAWVNRKVYNWRMELKKKVICCLSTFPWTVLAIFIIKILKYRIRVYKQQWCFLVFNTFWFAVMQILLCLTTIIWFEFHMQLYGQGSTARIRQIRHIDTVIISNLGFPKQTQNYKYHTRILKNVYIRYPYEYYQNKF